MIFECVNKTTNETWNGTITSFINYGSHYEIEINSRSSILVLLGKTSQGNFACMPDFGSSCHLANLKDKFYNTGKLTKVIGKIAAITTATALVAIAHNIYLL